MRLRGDQNGGGEAVGSGLQPASLNPFLTSEMPHPGFATTNVEIEEIPLLEVTIQSALTFLAHWESLRQGRLAPSWSEFDLLALGTEPVSRMMVVDVLTDPLRLKYRFWGTANVKVKGVEMTGRFVEDFPGRPGGHRHRRVSPGDFGTAADGLPRPSGPSRCLWRSVFVPGSF